MLTEVTAKIRLSSGEVTVTGPFEALRELDALVEGRSALAPVAVLEGAPSQPMPEIPADWKRLRSGVPSSEVVAFARSKGISEGQRARSRLIAGRLRDFVEATGARAVNIGDICLLAGLDPADSVTRNIASSRAQTLRTWGDLVWVEPGIYMVAT